MKNFACIAVFFSLSSLFGQGTNSDKVPCYERGKKQASGFGDWECGKLAGVVDCNEKLTYDEGSNTVLAGNVGKPFTGTCETCHMNGLLERRITFVDGKENGNDTTYYDTGCLQVVRNHILGVESGTWTFYYDSTTYVAWEMNYNLGQKHGVQTYFTRQGDTTKLETYSNGVLNGVKKTYYPKSKLEKEVHYVNGIFDGSFKRYNTEGNLLQELNYKEGKKQGEQKYYYEDGTLLSTEHWTMDVKDGEFKTLFYNGTIQTLENYRKGLQEGSFEEYWADGRPKRKAIYKKGVLIEDHLFDEQGNETYSFGAPTISGDEDDAMPTDQKKKGKKKKN
jgi:antitoxin component YwqK of YwqJK toxin-antitoxin module